MTAPDTLAVSQDNPPAAPLTQAQAQELFVRGRTAEIPGAVWRSLRSGILAFIRRTAERGNNFAAFNYACYVMDLDERFLQLERDTVIPIMNRAALSASMSGNELLRVHHAIEEALALFPNFNPPNANAIIAVANASRILEAAIQPPTPAPDLADARASLARLQGDGEDAARWRYCKANAGWIRSEGPYDYMAVHVVKGADLSCEAMRESAIDAARLPRPRRDRMIETREEMYARCIAAHRRGEDPAEGFGCACQPDKRGGWWTCSPCRFRAHIKTLAAPEVSR